MIAQAGFGVAMGNATERVQAEAELTIGHHLDEGLAAFIEERLLHVEAVTELKRFAARG
jgi:hydroxymethylpyrimidine pyrophosphatase-like HAD family hydrolase